MRNNIPLELQQLPQWVCAGADKQPLNPKTGKPASVSDISTWATYEEACAAGFPHVGFVLTEADPYTIIDLDNKPEKPCTPEQWARHQKILEAFDSYTERSTSGTGYHIVVKGTIPAGVHRDNVEVYSQSRYMICTGDVVRNSPINDHQPLLDVIYGEMKPDEMAELVEVESVLDDDEVLAMAMRAANAEKFNALCACTSSSGNGERKVHGTYTELGYESQSEADFALLSILAYYTTDNEQVRRLFRMSGLGKRDKAVNDNKYLNRALSKIRAKQPPLVDQLEVEALVAKAVATHHKTNPVPVPGNAEASPIVPGVSLPPGLVGDIAQYIFQSAIRPVPEVALVAALGLVAGISSRSYNVSQTGLNLYLILLGKTGVGKEGGKQGINRLIAAVRPQVPMVDQYVGPSAFASGQALVKHFNEQPCFYSVLDEFGHTLKRITAPKASGAELALHKELLALYSHSGPEDFIGVQAHSDKEKNTAVVRSPGLTIIGESTPDVFFDCLDSALIQDGLVPRLLVVEYAGGRPPRNRQAGGKPAATLVKRLVDLVTVAIQTGQNGRSATVELSADAEDMLDAFDSECDDHINRGGSTEVQLWNRAHLNALRVAAVLAVGSSPHTPVVNTEHARWAIDFVRRSLSTVQSRFDRGEAGGSDMSKAEAVLHKAVQAFLTMTPEERAKKHLGIPAKMREGLAIPHDFLRRRARDVQPFKGNPRLLGEILVDMVKAEVLTKVPPQQALEQYGSKGDCYVVGPNF
ncbi:DUF3987 domain-containing protein [Pseudomonas sp. R-28-1W-6]|uniref:phage NrS-1 polymerase family protein n=1 Tax=Pseudomonas sp. R-28-1W-6 TaxID=2650101 RepID=UPI0013661FA2|nr:DUF3987 domain-containing protein [Pseudomonas sp. R-28-1W-6]MWV11156.1 DUF3987 domain-containing protein [Pseudomonas sp. R-28-1W-6]